MLPEVDGSILEVLVIPESSISGRVVTMPILVLDPRQCVEIDNGIDTIFRTLAKMSQL